VDELSRFTDELGPAKIVQIWEPALELRAVVVIDNVSAGPSIGGTRMAPDVGVEECFRLARAMTLKNAAAGLRHGGGKSVIVGDPSMRLERKERLIRAFACAIRDLSEYIVGPDMGTDERCMGWVHDEIGRAVGLPRELGGIPLDELGATGFGLAICAEVARDFVDLDLDGARVAVQGYGAVGRHAARFLAERGTLLVAAADSRGSVLDPVGLDLERLSELKAEGKSVVDYPDGKKGAPDDVIGVECDIWIPAARPDVVRTDNVDRLKTRLVLQGANIPIALEAERLLHERGVLVVPDFIANAGGVICAAVEYHDGTETSAFEAIEEKLRTNTRQVLEEAARRRVPPRQSAIDLAGSRVRAASALRRWHRA
jgi:glutamate dehydrogenase (NAD(P)+)